ncbi:dihydroorotate dehydrogenase [Halarsenatibacter silvermanii]|uniref:Dihydroorotate dehydrogenase n=1 Tax=Halarsenatibacter silvermanii TaxID=321763 RepID=A0A1G9PTK1_9FIRM|nr:dihydroorotate dehydrogenase [Halarsenatibacter silvermanii]SDM02122.1 dihydroorotate dehydrogenase (NAD+) catalytic subunit [Halarsenatibacter silvermanii]
MTERSEKAVNLAVDLNGLLLKNPVTAASGTFGFGEEYSDFVDPDIPGAIFVKGVTPEPKAGNEPPRIAETPAGMLNSIGLQNPGVKSFIQDILPRIRNFDTRIIVNISGSRPKDYSFLAEKLSLKEVDALEVNISCPNVKKGGAAFGRDPEQAAHIVHLVREKTDKIIITKLSPETVDIAGVASAVESAGSDVISLINTLTGMKIDIDTGKPVLGNIKGGLSGPAIRPVAVRMVYEVAQEVEIPIIGLGGISSVRDVVEFLLAGARAVSVGTANFVNPRIIPEIIAGLEDYMLEHGIDDIEDLEGGVKG